MWCGHLEHHANMSAVNSIDLEIVQQLDSSASVNVSRLRVPHLKYFCAKKIYF